MPPALFQLPLQKTYYGLNNAHAIIPISFFAFI